MSRTWLVLIFSLMTVTNAKLALAVQGSAAAATSYERSLYSQAITECDRLAAHGEDPDKVAPGVSESAVNLTAAIAACRADVALDPGNPRLRYQLGRALAYAGNIEEALPNLEAATARAYPQAQFVLAYLLLEGRLKAPVDRCKALALLRDAATQKRMAAQIGLSVWQLAGLFRECTHQPTVAELLAHLSAARTQKPSFYPQLLIEDLERQLKALPSR